MAAVKKKAKYKPGQWVLVPYRPKPRKVQILEDIGCLGIDGEHEFLVLVPEGSNGEDEYTSQAAESEVIGPA
jgi:hypothetical protein